MQKLSLHEKIQEERILKLAKEICLDYINTHGDVNRIFEELFSAENKTAVVSFLELEKSCYNAAIDLPDYLSNVTRSYTERAELQANIRKILYFVILSQLSGVKLAKLNEDEDLGSAINYLINQLPPLPRHIFDSHIVSGAVFLKQFLTGALFSVPFLNAILLKPWLQQVYEDDSYELNLAHYVILSPIVALIMTPITIGIFLPLAVLEGVVRLAEILVKAVAKVFMSLGPNPEHEPQPEQNSEGDEKSLFERAMQIEAENEKKNQQPTFFKSQQQVLPFFAKYAPTPTSQGSDNDAAYQTPEVTVAQNS